MGQTCEFRSEDGAVRRFLGSRLDCWFQHTRSGRLARERRTIEAMLQMHCSSKHRTGGESLCEDCKALREYALLRLDRCVFKEEKPTCARCPIHCYAPARREEIRQIMRQMGPRMLFKHPWLAIQHALDAFRPIPRR